MSDEIKFLSAVASGWLLHVLYVQFVNWLAKKYDDHKSVRR